MSRAGVLICGTLPTALLLTASALRALPTPPLEGFRAGHGSCLSSTDGAQPLRSSWAFATLRPDGSAAECERTCLAAASCVAYVSDKRWSRCALVRNTSLIRSGDGGSPRHRCFLRHTYKRDSGDYAPRPVPLVIWSFWNDPGSKLLPVHPHDLVTWVTRRLEHGALQNQSEPLVQLSISSWRKLNPEYEIRVLGLDNFQQWLDAEDLPLTFDRLEVAHKADAIRIAILARHGGVWIDASGLLLKPLRAVFGPKYSHRVFLTTRRGDLAGNQERGDWAYYVENAFLAAPANDSLIVQVKDCFLEAFSELADIFEPRSLEASGLFSQEQLEEMASLGIKDSYLTMHACFFKALDEDMGLRQFWDGPWLQRIEGSRGLFPHLYFWGDSWTERLFHEERPELVDRLLDGEGFLVKFREVDRRLLGTMGLQQLLCQPSTFRVLLGRLGVGGSTACQSSTAVASHSH